MATKKTKLPTINLPKKKTNKLEAELIKRGENVMDNLARSIKARRGGGF